MAMLDGMDMHPEKKSLKDNHRKENQLKIKTNKNHISNCRGTGQRRTRKATTEKVDFFGEFLDENDLR